MNTYIPEEYRDIMGRTLRLAAALTTQVTDFNEGAVLRTLFEAPVGAVAAYQAQLAGALNSYLDYGAYKIFGFDLTPAAAAYGTVVLTIPPAPSTATVAAGRIFLVPGTQRRYSVVSNVSIAINQTSVTVPIAATAVGSIYNTQVGTITQMSGSIPGITITSCTNPQALTNGTDLETTSHLRARFNAWYQATHRASRGAVEGAAMTATVLDGWGRVQEAVTQVLTVDNGDGRATEYIYSGTGVAATAALVLACQNIVTGYVPAGGGWVDGYQAAGVRITAAAAAIQSVAVASTSKLLTGFSTALLLPQVRAAVQSVFATLGIGQPLYLSQLSQAVLQITGISDISFVTTPAAVSGAVTPAAGTMLVAGAITLA